MKLICVKFIMKVFIYIYISFLFMKKLLQGFTIIFISSSTLLSVTACDITTGDYNAVTFNTSKIKFTGDDLKRQGNVNFYFLLKNEIPTINSVYRNGILTKFNWNSLNKTKKDQILQVAAQTEGYARYLADQKSITDFNIFVSIAAYPDESAYMNWFKPSSQSVTLIQRVTALGNYLRTLNSHLQNADKIFDLFKVANLPDDTEGNNVRAKLLEIYNVFFKIASKDAVGRLVREFTLRSSPTPGVVGGTVFGTYEDKLLQYIEFYQKDVYKKSFVNQQYDAGWWSSDNNGTVLIHELGHVLSGISGLSPKILLEQTHSSRYYLNYGSFGKNPLYIFQVTPDDYLVNYIGNQVKTKVRMIDDDATLIKAAAYDIVRSNYARYSSYNNGQIQNADMFAESFAAWFLTPDKYKSQSWEILNNYFTHVNQQMYQTKKILK